MRHGLIVLVAAACTLAGCDQWRNLNDSEAQRLVGAEPLGTSYNGMTLADVSGPTVTINAKSVPVDDNMRKNWVGAVAADSLYKCQAFAARLAVGENSSDLALDLATLALAGISAITVPAQSAHALAAAAGITAGSRAAIDTDVFAKNTAPFIVQQIDKTYFTSMNAYLATFPPQSVVPGVEFAKIQNIHSNCSLELAIASLGSGTQGAAAQTAPIGTGDLQPNQYFKTGIGVVYQITGPVDANGNWPVKSYQIGATAQAIAAANVSNYSPTILLQLLNSLSAVKSPTG
jgi:hypothetical protein